MLELGGKSPCSSTTTPTWTRPSHGVHGIFVHSGQGCVCGSRIFVQRGVYDQVVDGVANMANFIKLGGPDKRVAERPPISASSSPG